MVYKRQDRQYVKSLLHYKLRNIRRRFDIPSNDITPLRILGCNPAGGITERAKIDERGACLRDFFSNHMSTEGLSKRCSPRENPAQRLLQRNVTLCLEAMAQLASWLRLEASCNPTFRSPGGYI